MIYLDQPVASGVCMKPGWEAPAIGRILGDCPSPQRRAIGGEGLPWAAYCELTPLTQIDADGIGVNLDMPTELGLRSQPHSDTVTGMNSS